MRPIEGRQDQIFTKLHSWEYLTYIPITYILMYEYVQIYDLPGIKLKQVNVEFRFHPRTDSVVGGTVRAILYHCTIVLAAYPKY